MKSAKSKAGKYIVVLKRAAKVQSRASVAQAMQEVEDAVDVGSAERIFSVALQGGVYRLEEGQADLLANDPAVAYVEEDQIVTINAQQNSAPWGLDRIDQASFPLNLTYNSPDGGAQVNAYVIDTGILTSHQEFQGRASSGFDFVDDDQDATDCNGHGTHVAGTVGGATYGVAKNVKLFGVRVLDCFGSGSFSDVIAGIEWVTANHVKPAVANMSLGGGVSQAVDDAVKASIAAGVTYVLAAGNENMNACNTSPARVPEAITVGSTTKADQRSSFSNFGTCVDIFAPGSDITSAWYTSTTATETISGTSMASPHVAGAAALYLAANPLATPAQVASALNSGAILGKISGAGTGSPNKLLNIGFLSGQVPDEEEEVPQDPGLQNGVAVSGLNAAKGTESYYTINVPEGAKDLVVTISGGRGDADLYLKFGSKPTVSSYECRPYTGGNSESCSVKAPKAGVYHVMVRAYLLYSDLTIKANFVAIKPKIVTASADN